MDATWPRREVSELCLAIVDCVNRTAPTVEGPTRYRMIRTTNVRGGFVDLSQCNGIFLGQRLVSYRPNPKLLDERFLLYTMLGPELQGQIRSLGAGATVAHMRVPDAKRLLIPTPPLHLQQRIGSILAAYDDLIEVNRRRIVILEEMARRIFHEWFGRVLTKAGAEPTSGPDGWASVKLGDIIGLKYGRALKADQRKPGTVPVYGSSGIVGCHNESIVEGPALIVGRKGNVGSIHYSALSSYPIDTVFFVETTWPILFVEQVLRRQTFLNSDAAVPGLNKAQALSIPITLPPRQMADRYQSIVEPFREQGGLLSRQITNLAAQRDLLLPKLISGEIDVSEVPAIAEAAE